MTDNTFSSAGNINLLRQNEIAMLQKGICPRRYERNVPMFGLEGQRTLLKSHVAVVGCGGLGGIVLNSWPVTAWDRLPLLMGMCLRRAISIGKFWPPWIR